MHNCELGPRFKWWSISPTSRRICGSVLQRFFSMTFVFVKMEQSNAGIPVNVIKPVPKSEKIVGVGNMTNILDDMIVEWKGGDALLSGSKDSSDRRLQSIKISEFGSSCAFATRRPLDGPLFSFPRWRSRRGIPVENYSHFFPIPPSFPRWRSRWGILLENSTFSSIWNVLYHPNPREIHMVLWFIKRNTQGIPFQAPKI